MPEFEIAYLHEGKQRVAVIYARDHRDAYRAFESLKSTGVIGDEIVQRGAIDIREDAGRQEV